MFVCVCGGGGRGGVKGVSKTPNRWGRMTRGQRAKGPPRPKDLCQPVAEVPSEGWRHRFCNVPTFFTIAMHYFYDHKSRYL